ncbi:fibrillin-2-like [Ornithodoros turicata]|uniref:fibrillin-2-like n=1 Tax=Ornithodoros turicata TaxID=34597 RepID=UPI0031394B19
MKLPHAVCQSRIQYLLLCLSACYLACHAGCPSLPSPDHGSVHHYAQHNIASFTCEHGYVLKGNMTSICLFNKWSTDVPQCVLEREEPSDERLLSWSGTRYGSSPEAVIRKPRTRTGRVSGRYHHYATSTAPPPVPSLLPIVPAKIPSLRGPKISIDCEVPVSLPNGFVYLNRQDKSVVDYRCSRNFHLKGSSTARCSDGGWSSPPPLCQPVDAKYVPPAATAPRENPCAFDYDGCDHICLFNGEKAFCLCRYGYTRVGKKCLAPHRPYPCSTDNGGCSHGCINDGGLAKCFCRRGFTLGQDLKTCIDIDECSTLAHRCHNCVNIPGSYRCYCNNGYKPTPDKLSCEDIDECQINDGRCHHLLCINTEGSYACGCPHGYQLGPDKRSCSDVNECSRPGITEICPMGCVNSPGSFQCLSYTSTEGSVKEESDDDLSSSGDGPTPWSPEDCGKGYLRSGNGSCEDVDECKVPPSGNKPCEDTCVNEPGSFRCECRPGRRKIGNGRCQDCPRNTYLVRNRNTCQGCPRHSHTLGTRKTSFADCRCDNGFTGMHGVRPPCQDIDECTTNKLQCSHRCVNTPGSAYCACPTGFYLGKDGRTCADVNECAQRQSICDQECTNTIGSYVCRCKSGYELSSIDKRTCSDIDECATNNGGCEESCVNIPGRYYCTCSRGWKVAPDLHSCIDVDECAQKPHICDQECTNTIGSYACGCKRGYALSPLDKRSCRDIDECATENGGCEGSCVNIPGSYYCTCPRGWKVAADLRSCVDVDECAESLHACDQECMNTIGSYTCQCKSGYELSSTDGRTCNDINECAANNGGCKGSCVNFPGGHYCTCTTGFKIAADLRGCVEITCPAFLEVPNSKTRCKPNVREGKFAKAGTVCNITCKFGYELEGGKTIRCLESGTWSSAPPTCAANSCPALFNPDNGRVLPERCLSDTDNLVLSQCTYTCKEGFTLNGNMVNTCRRNGTWKYPPATCEKRNVALSITCPLDVTVVLPRGNDSVTVDLPRARSTTANAEDIEVHPKYIQDYSAEFPHGVTIVTYVANDPRSGMTSNCSFAVEVIDKEPPTIVRCPGSVHAYATKLEGALVKWDEPEFEDNVFVDSVKPSQEPGTLFSVGEHFVRYVASDFDGNQATCEFKVIVQGKECTRPRKMKHGDLECYDWLHGVICEPFCDEGYILPSNVPSSYTCDLSGTWEPRSWIPECSEIKDTPTGKCMPGSEYFDEVDVCVECPPGMFWDADTATCLLCESGFYQDQPGHPSCKECPSAKPTTVSQEMEKQCFA